MRAARKVRLKATGEPADRRMRVGIGTRKRSLISASMVLQLYLPFPNQKFDRRHAIGSSARHQRLPHRAIWTGMNCPCPATLKVSIIGSATAQIFARRHAGLRGERFE